MKVQVIFFMLIFYMIYAQAEQNYQQTPSYHITVNAQTGADAHQDNDIKQQAHHKSDLQTHVNSAGRETERQLDPTVSALNYTVRNGAKVLLLATGARSLPTLATGAYLVNRLVIFNYLIETPFLETATKEEVKELAAQGKYKVPEPIVFPIAHYIYRCCEKKFTSKK